MTPGSSFGASEKFIMKSLSAQMLDRQNEEDFGSLHQMHVNSSFDRRIHSSKEVQGEKRTDFLSHSRDACDLLAYDHYVTSSLRINEDQILGHFSSEKLSPVVHSHPRLLKSRNTDPASFMDSEDLMLNLSYVSARLS